MVRSKICKIWVSDELELPMRASKHGFLLLLVCRISNKQGVIFASLLTYMKELLYIFQNQFMLKICKKIFIKKIIYMDNDGDFIYNFSGMQGNLVVLQ